LLAKLEKVISSLRSDSEAQPSRLPELLTLSDVAARPVDWLWQPYLALGMLGMLSGDPGAGKTFISMAIAAALSNGRVPYSGEQCSPIDVLYLSVENSPEHVLRPRSTAWRETHLGFTYSADPLGAMEETLLALAV
jgi:AAA domain